MHAPGVTGVPGVVGYGMPPASYGAPGTVGCGVLYMSVGVGVVVGGATIGVVVGAGDGAGAGLPTLSEHPDVPTRIPSATRPPTVNFFMMAG